MDRNCCTVPKETHVKSLLTSSRKKGKFSKRPSLSYYLRQYLLEKKYQGSKFSHQDRLQYLGLSEGFRQKYDAKEHLGQLDQLLTQRLHRKRTL
mmetsp:Transcript_43276/g.41663  ORF Transcript_43276/g.41663 Transcript_43276/m.41663 type:complete len:94 (+) Transcript_43276:775-1056(+)